jgi:hypothetical protein
VNVYSADNGDWLPPMQVEMPDIGQAGGPSSSPTWARLRRSMTARRS